MKLIYIVNARMPTEKAHGIQIAKTCESLVKAGINLELWLPRRRNPKFAGRDLFEFYSLTCKFPVRKVACLDLIGWLNFFPGLAFFLESKTFAWSIARLIKNGAYDGAVFYCRDSYPLLPILKRGLPYFFEIHDLSPKPRGFLIKLLSASRGIVAITRGLAEDLGKFAKQENILVAEDGVDLQKFAVKLNREQVRLKLGFPADNKIVLYTGHLYAWKGVITLAQAAGYLPADAWVCFVGGTDRDVSNFKNYVKENRLQRVEIIGQVPYEQVPLYLAAADILVLPNSAKFKISEHYTSPLKLFEYMASHRPIVSSDLPSLREILDESTAVFFIPDDPISLGRKINQLLSDQGLSERLATNAASRVNSYTWDKRAEKIINFIKNKAGGR
jgi:glycosyltransferase involved in cell wall biosynthesis